MYSRLHNVNFLVTKLPPKHLGHGKLLRANMCTVLNGTIETRILSRFCLQLLNMQHAPMGLFCQEISCFTKSEKNRRGLDGAFCL